MAVRKKPYTVTVTPQVEGVGLSDGATETVACMIIAVDATQYMAKTGIELKRPHEIYCEVADGDKFTLGAKVVWQGRSYIVMNPPTIRPDGGAAHACILIEENQHGR